MPLAMSKQLEMQIPTLLFVLKLAGFWQAHDCNFIEAESLQ